MRDDHGYYGQFRQQLYFASLHSAALAQLEQAGVVDISHLQQQACYREAALGSLYRALCYLACSALPPAVADSLLSAPRQLLNLLEEEQAATPRAAISTLLQALYGEVHADAPGQPSLDTLPAAYRRLWASGQSRRPAAVPGGAQIPVREVELASADLAHLASQLMLLGEQLVALQTES